MGQDLFLLLPAVQEALESAQIGAQRAAAAQLALRYARLMDEPVAAGKYRAALRYLDKLWEHWDATIRMTPTEAKGMETALDTIRMALAEHSVASDLGPKLLATLEKLNMTIDRPVSASQTQEPAGESVQPPSARDELKAKRIERDRAREHGA